LFLIVFVSLYLIRIFHREGEKRDPHSFISK
jgi:hypothetical protein